MRVWEIYREIKKSGFQWLAAVEYNSNSEMLYEMVRYEC